MNDLPAAAAYPRWRSFLYIIATYAVASAAAWFAFDMVPATWPLASLTGFFASTLVTIVASLLVRNGSVFDPWWSVLPPVAAFWLAHTATELHPRAALVLPVVGLWALRLTLNWARGWPGLHHEDWRYAKLYRDWPLPWWLTLVLGVELFPMLIVWLGCLPLGTALSAATRPLRSLDALALVIGLAATAIEFVADEQMRRFTRQRQPGEIMQSGLWRYSRHPNYFGEILFWVSLWLFAVSADPAVWWTGIGGLAIVLMFVFASIPMLDERSRERRPGFEAYARRTSALVPRPPRRD